MEDKELKEMIKDYPKELKCHPRTAFEEQLFKFLKEKLKQIKKG